MLFYLNFIIVFVLYSVNTYLYKYSIDNCYNNIDDNVNILLLNVYENVINYLLINEFTIVNSIFILNNLLYNNE